MDNLCRYCGASATRWSGADLYVFDFKTKKIINIGPQYCCDSCDHDNKWIPIGSERKYEKFDKPKRKAKTINMTRIQQNCMKQDQEDRTFAENDSD